MACSANFELCMRPPGCLNDTHSSALRYTYLDIDETSIRLVEKHTPICFFSLPCVEYTVHYHVNAPDIRQPLSFPET